MEGESSQPSTRELLQPIMDQLADLQRRLGHPHAGGVALNTPEEVVRAAEQPDFQETALTKAGNKEQLKFCRVILGLVEAASRCFDQNGSVPQEGAQPLAGYLRALETAATARVKLIRLADRSEAGWGIVRHYQADRIADNSDDERRIRSAESQAAAERKKAASKAKSSGSLSV